MATYEEHNLGATIQSVVAPELRCPVPRRHPGRGLAIENEFIYVVGDAPCTAIFKEGFEINAANPASHDIFVIKINRFTNRVIWTKRVGSNGRAVKFLNLRQKSDDFDI